MVIIGSKVFFMEFVSGDGGIFGIIHFEMETDACLRHRDRLR